MGLHSEGLNIISEGYLRLRFIFLGGGGEGGGLLLRGLVFEEGVGLNYYILRYSPVRTCVRSC